MATKKVTQLAEITSADATDLVMIVDVSDTSMSPNGTNKKIQKSNLVTGGGGTVVSVKVSINNASVLDMKYDDTPITLKAAESGKIIVPVSCVCVATHSLSDESSSADLRLGWDASSSTTSKRWGESRDWMNGVTSGTLSTCFGGPSTAATNQLMTFSFTNTPFQIWCTGVFNGGWSMDVYFSYYMVDA